MGFDPDHVCLLYDSRAEQLVSLAHFHRQALADGRRCIHVATNGDADGLDEALEDLGVDAGDAQARGALSVLTTEEVYLAEGRFDPQVTVAFWRAALDAARSAGFPALAVSGDMGWALGDEDALQRLGDYETQMEASFRSGEMHAICCYGRREFSPEGIARAFCTHRGVVLGGRTLRMDPLVDATSEGRVDAEWLAPLLQRLRDSEEEVRSALTLKERVLEVAPVGIYTCDAEGRITAFNPAAAEVWGRTPRIGDRDERFCGSYRLYLPDGQFLPHAETPMATALREGVGCEGREVVVERPDGSFVVLLASIAPMKDDAGRVTGALNCFVDVTERKEAEEALRAADRQKDEFLAMLAHELRNPLAPVRSALDLLRGGPESERERALAVLDRQVGTLSRLVNDLLDVSRVKRGRIRIEREDLDLVRLLRCVIGSNGTMFEDRRQTLTVSLPEAPVWVHGDATRLEQIFVNLLSNAAKYTPEGGRVWVMLEREGEDAAFRVADDGPGIDPELEARLFELFAQGKRALDRAEGGLGVGLALTKRLAELHGGTVSASPRDPQGSEFVVRLPVIGAPAEVEAPVGNREHGNQETGVDDEAHGSEEGTSGGLRVLYVEDLSDARELAELVLRTMGHEVVTAADGPAALEVMPQFRPDVVMLDIGLPRMDGYEVARRIRADPDFGHVVLVAITGYAEQEHRERSREVGFDHHLVKPVDYLTTVRELLEEVANGGGSRTSSG